jgi:hypothetical protein
MFEHVGIDLGYDDLTANTSESGRLYETPDGKNYPSITTVLSILSNDAIKAWRQRVGEDEANRVMYRASERGTAVHAIIEDYLNNVDDYRSRYMPNVIENFLSLKPILDTRIGKIYAQEVPLFSHHLKVAGRVDCVAEFDGKISIIDFKTSKRPKSRDKITNYFMQESAYAIMFEERTGMPITQLVTLIAVDNAPPEVYIEHRDNWTKPLLETIKKYETK